MHTDSLTSQLARILARPVDPTSRGRAALHVSDWLGCAVGATRTDSGAALARWAAQQPEGPCRLVGGPAKDASTALVVNGALGNALEMDDMHGPAIVHPGPVVIPAAIAVAQLLRSRGLLARPAAGHALLDAIVRGYEATVRVGMAVGPGHYRYWHKTATCGVFGSAAAAASLLGLGHAATVDALGNAGTQAGGLWQVRNEAVMGKQWHNARAASGGVQAAELAQAGFTGPAFVLEGAQGLFAATCPDAVPGEVAREPDAPWAMADMSFKPWPACRHAHAAIDAALVLRNMPGASKARRYEVETYGDAITFCNRPHPRTPLEARFSLQHAVAVVMLSGEPRMDDFEPARFLHEACAQLRARVEVRAAEPFASAYPSRYGARVRAILDDGTELRAEVADALGDPRNPLPRPAIMGKARMLMAWAGWSPERAQSATDACLALAEAGTLEQLDGLLEN